MDISMEDWAQLDAASTQALAPHADAEFNGMGLVLFALQFAVAAGAHVWVTSGSDEKITRAVGLGAAMPHHANSDASPFLRMPLIPCGEDRGAANVPVADALRSSGSSPIVIGRVTSGHREVHYTT
jgi:D-arabinose 1-dehydrogenase-like Zn-dependent alcohol dehydrogenase